MSAVLALSLALTACNSGTSPNEMSGNFDNSASSSSETPLEQPNGVSGIEEFAFEGCSAEIYYKGNIYTEENYDEIYKIFE